MGWQVERYVFADLRNASARDVVQNALVWVTRENGEERRITVELTREASVAGHKLDPPNDVTAFLNNDEPPTLLSVTTAGIVAPRWFGKDA